MLVVVHRTNHEETPIFQEVSKFNDLFIINLFCVAGMSKEDRLYFYGDHMD